MQEEGRGEKNGGGRTRAANLADPKFQVIKSGRRL